MSNKATISKKDERLLHTKSGNRCAMCKAVLVDVENPFAACVGENAHIYIAKSLMLHDMMLPKILPS